MEDIKILEKIVKEIIYDDNCETFENEAPINIAKAIENLIARNKELEGSHETAEEEIQEQAKALISYEAYMRDEMIPKSKVKEKIEAIKNKRKEDGECELALHGFQREAKIEALQELLEE